MTQLKARMRAEIFHALEGDELDQRPTLSNENLIINELIKDYLDFNMYKHTVSVLKAGKLTVGRGCYSIMHAHCGEGMLSDHARTLALAYLGGRP